VLASSVVQVIDAVVVEGVAATALMTGGVLSAANAAEYEPACAVKMA
jgi:hypothetical protein